MPNVMPDVAHSSRAAQEGTLNWVGMSQIEVPLMVSADDSSPRQVSAKVEAMVNLARPEAKGIHMSRLYLSLDQLSTEQELDIDSIKGLLAQFIDSHETLSNQAHVKFDFDYHLRRPSLISGKLGWKAYPVQINARLAEGEINMELKVVIPYSSTCPCSAALARQLIQKAFKDEFGQHEDVSTESVTEWLGSTKGIVATPHSQRSTATVTVMLDNKCDTLPISKLIDLVEGALKTPVQAAVKREDEQEFARLNGQNLMFVEDSARRLKHALGQFSLATDFMLRVDHLESLHAHDAAAVVVKGVEGGYQA